MVFKNSIFQHINYTDYSTTNLEKIFKKFFLHIPFAKFTPIINTIIGIQKISIFINL